MNSFSRSLLGCICLLLLPFQVTAQSTSSTSSTGSSAVTSFRPNQQTGGAKSPDKTKTSSIPTSAKQVEEPTKSTNTSNRKRILLQEQMGGWSGGGGSGVACWSDVQDAKEAFVDRLTPRPISAGLRRRINTLFVTDYWEHRDRQFVDIGTDTGPKTYLHRILSTYLGLLAPSFLTKIEDALNKVNLDPGNYIPAAGTLKSVEDVGLVRGLESGIVLDESYGYCALVPIAVRYARTENNVTETKVYLDQDLYNKLGLVQGRLNKDLQIQNQSLLRLHEALYLLGYGLHKETSEDIREMGSLLLQQDFYSHLYEETIHTRQVHPGDQNAVNGVQAILFIKAIYEDGFGQFPYIGDAPVSAKKARFRSGYKNFEEEFMWMNAKLGRMQQLGHPLSLLHRLTTEWFATLKDETAFIAISQVAIGFGISTDFYQLLDPTSDTSDQEKKVCEFALEQANILVRTGDENNLNLSYAYFAAHQFCVDNGLIDAPVSN